MAAIIVSACIATTICAQRWEAKPCDCRFGFLARGVCFPVSPQRAVAPVMTIAGVGTRSATLNYEHGPVAVMLDLMNPVIAFGRLVGQAWKLRRDKAKSGNARRPCYLPSSFGSLAMFRCEAPRFIERQSLGGFSIALVGGDGLFVGVYQLRLL